MITRILLNPIIWVLVALILRVCLGGPPGRRPADEDDSA